MKLGELIRGLKFGTAPIALLAVAPWTFFVIDHSYPADALKAGVSGAVILHVLIGRQGQVEDVKVVSGREMLRTTAVDAVKQWKYRPYQRNGVDVEVETDVEVQFSLLDR